MLCLLSFCPGKCFRLYPEDERLPAEIRPLILESNITPTVLFLKRLEIAGLAQCNFMDRPGEDGGREGAILGSIADADTDTFHLKSLSVFEIFNKYAFLKNIFLYQTSQDN